MTDAEIIQKFLANAPRHREYLKTLTLVSHLDLVTDHLPEFNAWCNEFHEIQQVLMSLDALNKRPEVQSHPHLQIDETIRSMMLTFQNLIFGDLSFERPWEECLPAETMASLNREAHILRGRVKSTETNIPELDRIIDTLVKRTDKDTKVPDALPIERMKLLLCQNFMMAKANMAEVSWAVFLIERKYKKLVV